MSVVGIVLAAGRGTRMGADPKQLLLLGGRPLLQHVVDAAVAAGLDDLLVVLGHEAGRVAPALRLPASARVIVNPDHADGQAGSLAAGLRNAPPHSDAALVLLGDQPEVRVDAIRAVIASAPAGAAVARASYGGRPGHPVLLSRSLWPELAAARGDSGVRALISSRAERPALVEVGGSPPADIDTLDDFERLVRRSGSGTSTEFTSTDEIMRLTRSED